MTILEIFAEKGEASFRRLEKQLLAAVLQGESRWWPPAAARSLMRKNRWV